MGRLDDTNEGQVSEVAVGMGIALADIVMDVKRERPKVSRRKLGIGLGSGLVAAVSAATWVRRPDGRPRLRRDQLTIAPVRLAAFERKVQARGTLVPEHLHWVSATGPASVSRIAVRPGDAVKEGELLVELSNADLELAALEAESAAAAAETLLTTMKAQGSEALLALEAELAQLEGEVAAQQVDAETVQALAAKGLASKRDERTKRRTTEGRRARLRIERKRRRAMNRGTAARLHSAEKELRSLRKVASFRRRQLEALRVVAPAGGVVQELPLEPGQWMSAGSLLAKIAKPGALEAELQVPESSASEVAVGQAAALQVGQATAAGRVMRVDPAVQAGSVRVDVRLDGPLPEGARADLAITGVIALERVEQALVLARPVGVVPRSTARVFVYDEAGRQARPVQVTFGRASVREIEIERGLEEGDQVVVAGAEAIPLDDGGFVVVNRE